MKKLLKSHGFTLIEVLLVVAIIAILAGVVIIAINPGKQLAQARNTQRWEDINTILNAVYQYSIDNDGDVPSAITFTEQSICKADIPGSSCLTNGLVRLWELTENEEYITSIPIDPTAEENDYDTDYNISKSALNNRITVVAPNAELGENIQVTR